MLFYSRDNDKPMKGIMGHFQDKLKYWHCEIAFPLDLFESDTLPQPPAGISRDSLVWAYGVFNANKEYYPRGEILLENGGSIVIDPDRDSPPDASGERRVVQIDSGVIRKSTELSDEEDSRGSPISVQHQIYKCARRRFFGGNTLITWPDGKQNVGDAQIKVRKGDGMIELSSPGTVFGKHRTFSRPNYIPVCFYVPWRDAARAVNYCSAQVGKQYDHAGIRRSHFWPATHSIDMKKVYCVNLVITALQQANIAKGRNPNGLTTDELYEILERHPGVKISSLLPHREEAFMERSREAEAKRFDNRSARSKGRGKSNRRKRNVGRGPTKMKTMAQITREARGDDIV